MILGKFLPPHAGHQYLVQFAQNFTQRLTVLVCSIAREPIPGTLRYAWMRELFPDARVVPVDEELPQTPDEHPHFWDIWRDVVERAVGEPIDFVFASEPYGVRLAAELGATFIPVDLSRSQVPVSGSAIRARPLTHWRFLPECVRPYFVKRVCLFGPESVGKSTLARDLATHFDTVAAAEFAREWLDPKGGVCEESDLTVIARGQMASEESLARRANRVLFCDTDVLTTTVWSDFLYGRCPEWMRAEAQRTYDLTLLLDVDVPWVDDGQRSLQNRRQAFFDCCRTALERSGRRFVVVRGDWDDRFRTACEEVEKLLREEVV